MLFYKPIVSLIVAFAAASSVAASATPVARTEYPPPSPLPSTVNQCNTGTVQCCNTWTNTQNPSLGVIGVLLQLLLNVNFIQGLQCTSVLQNCNSQPVCCQNIDQNALIAINCSPINL